MLLVTEFKDKQGQYYAFVERVVPYRGVLKLVHASDTSLVLREKKVTISYDALFGPDIDDVREWSEQINEWTTEIEKEKSQ